MFNKFNIKYKIIQLDQFIKSIKNKKNTSVTFEDGKNALILANSEIGRASCRERV